MWTAEMVSTLRKLWALGLSASQIAKQIPGVTKNSVIGKAHRLRLDKRPSPIVGMQQARTVTHQKVRAHRSVAAFLKIPNEVVADYRAQLSPDIMASFVPSLPKARRPPTIVEVPMEQSPGYTLGEVQDWSGCLWPFGGLKDRPTQWCGCTRAPGSSYCAHHHAMSRQRATGSIKAAEKYPGWAA